MGGGFYTRSVFSSGGGCRINYSREAQLALSHGSFHSELDPRGRTISCDSGTPIVVALDVTGSMGDWSKIIYDKMPMFFGQMIMHEYCSDPVIAFAGVGDAVCDKAPLQVTDFARGVAIENGLKKLWLEAGGGGACYGEQESYDLAVAFFASSAVSIPEGQKGFFFITGDEGVYNPVPLPWMHKWAPVAAHEIFSQGSCRNQTPNAIFERLKRRFHVFHIKKPYTTARNIQILEQWQSLLGSSHVIEIEDAKGIVDIMLGIMALVCHTRNLDQYITDMEERGQSIDRQAEIRRLLQPLADELVQPAGAAASSAGLSRRDRRRAGRANKFQEKQRADVTILPMRGCGKTTMFASLGHEEKVEVLSYAECAMANDGDMDDDTLTLLFADLPEDQKFGAMSLWLSSQ